MLLFLSKIHCLALSNVGSTIHVNLPKYFQIVILTDTKYFYKKNITLDLSLENI